MPVEINKSDRTALKTFFVRNAIPTESNFAALIDASFNQKDDGVAKAANNPLSIEAGADARAGSAVLDLYETFDDEQPAWGIGLQAGSRPGLAITRGGGEAKGPRLFVDAATGNVGIGSTAPADPLDVAGDVRVGSAGNPIRFTSKWSNFPATSGDAAEISNDTDRFKTLMLVGNRSAGNVRRVSVWDHLEVNGNLNVTAGASMGDLNVRRNADLDGVVTVGSNPLRFTSAWSGHPDRTTNGSEISNDTGVYKTLMIIGNRSAAMPRPGGGVVRRVSVWDRLEVNGTLEVSRQDPWQNVRYQSGWTTYSDGRTYGSAQYFKDSLGTVHLRGLIAGGATGRIAFNLPGGYRPTSRVLFACQTAPNAIGRLDVETNGNVWVMAGSSGWVSLHGLSFPTN